MGPLYRNSDMGQKHAPCWMTNDTMGQEKQRDHIIQKAHNLFSRSLCVVCPPAKLFCGSATATCPIF